METQSSTEEQVSRLFSYGFRPLFLCAVAIALIAIPWWTGVFAGYLPSPSLALPAVAWHAHEMLFGFVGAAIGGFLLTAVSNWTKRPPVQGWMLALLVGCWIAGRAVLAYGMDWSPLAVMLIDTSYWLLLTVLIGREVILSGNTRNLKIAGVLLMFTALAAFFHFQRVFNLNMDTGQMSLRAVLVLVCVMISIIGGRVIPAFTGNWLRLNFGPTVRTPVSFNHFDAAVIVLTAILAVAYSLRPVHFVTGCMFILTGVLHLVRQARWCPWQTWRNPLVLVLHTGYAWLGTGFLLLGAAIITARLPTSSGIHGLGIGAMAGLILAVSSRAALGHTGRPLVASALLSIAFVLINLTAVARVVASMASNEWLLLAAALWVAAFSCFAIRFVPILVGPAAPPDTN